MLRSIFCQSGMKAVSDPLSIWHSCNLSMFYVSILNSVKFLRVEFFIEVASSDYLISWKNADYFCSHNMYDMLISNKKNRSESNNIIELQRTFSLFYRFVHSLIPLANCFIFLPNFLLLPLRGNRDCLKWDWWLE